MLRAATEMIEPGLAAMSKEKMQAGIKAPAADDWAVIYARSCKRWHPQSHQGAFAAMRNRQHGRLSRARNWTKVGYRNRSSARGAWRPWRPGRFAKSVVPGVWPDDGTGAARP